MIVGIIAWIVIGLLVGFIAAKVIDLRGDDPRLGIAVACGAAIVGAVLYTGISGAEVSAWNLWSILFAAMGAVIGVVTWHAVRSRYVSRAPYTRRSSY